MYASLSQKRFTFEDGMFGNSSELGIALLISIVRGIDEVIRGSREWFNHYKNTINTNIRKYRNNIDLQLTPVWYQYSFILKTNKQNTMRWFIFMYNINQVIGCLVSFIPSGEQNQIIYTMLEWQPKLDSFGVYVFLLLPKLASIAQYHCLVMIMVTNHRAFLLYIVIDSLW